jgi:hypothetical protein
MILSQNDVVNVCLLGFSRHMGRRWWWRVLITYNLVLLKQNIIGFIIANSINKRSPFQVWHNLNFFCYGCITWMHVHFWHIFKLHHGLKVCWHLHEKLWMVGLHQVPHSKKDIQPNIESYHEVLKCWFSFETKGLRGHYIDWLVWRLTIIVTQHYMHQAKIKRQGS